MAYCATKKNARQRHREGERVHLPASTACSDLDAELGEDLARKTLDVYRLRLPLLAQFVPRNRLSQCSETILAADGLLILEAAQYVVVEDQLRMVPDVLASVKEADQVTMGVWRAHLVAAVERLKTLA